MPSSTITAYRKYLRENLPEYQLLSDTIPAPPAEIVLRLNVMTPIKYGSGGGAAPFATVQPARLAFPGSARLGQIKHYRAKRDKIIAFLTSGCQRKGLVLKKYERWDNFTVGLPGSDDEDVVYQHLARLEKDTADLTSGFGFFTRCLFGMTTPEQKEAYVKKYLAKNAPQFELVHFEHNNLFYIARKDTSTGLGSGGRADMDGVHEFFSNRAGDTIRVQGRPLTSMSDLTVYSNASTQSTYSFLQERKLKALRQAQVEILEAAGVFGVGADPYMQMVSEVSIAMRGGVAHDAGKAIKEAMFGKHSRTHPVRATRMALSKIFSVLPGIVRAAGVKIASAAVSTALAHGESGAQGISGAASAAVGDRAVPRWVRDAGLSPSEDELNQKRWTEITEHINSLEKWEKQFGEIEDRIRTERRDVVTCAQMNELLRCYAKIQFHLDKLVAAYEEEITGLNKIGALVSDTKSALGEFELKFKEFAVEYFNRKRSKLKKASTAGSLFETGGASYLCYRYTVPGATENNMESFLAGNPELRGGPSDNDAGEMAAED